MTGCYLDASAIVKLATEERESQSLRAWLHAHPQRLTSRVSTVEVVRALRRKGTRSVQLATDVVRDAFDSVAILELNGPIADGAAMLAPRDLRSLDAVHLASALALGEELDVMVTYDRRLADAARAAGLEVVAPA